MRPILAFLLPLAVNGATVRLDERQINVDALSGIGGGAIETILSGLVGWTMSKKAALKVENIPAKMNIPGAKRVRMLYGPYKLKAANSTVKVGNFFSMDKGGTGYASLVDSDFPRDITTLETLTDLLDEKFQRADTKDGIYNHHLSIMDLNRGPSPGYACEGKTANIPPFSVYGAGATETGPLRFAAMNGSIKTGYYIARNRRILSTLDVVNYNNVERNVYVRMEIEYLPGRAPGYLDVRQERIDPGMCGGAANGNSLRPPKGVSKFTVNSTGIVIGREGYIVNLRGHMHDGGVNAIVRINGKEVCNSKAVYGGEGATGTTADGKVWETIQTTSYCWDPIHVFKGDKLFMEANYDMGLHPPREQGGHEAMGMRRFTDMAPISGDDSETGEQMALIITHFAYPN